jgi:hypothetical protein
VGNWYRVSKRINGRLYDYWQRTKRVGRSVKTENKYIGPASSGITTNRNQINELLGKQNPEIPSTPTVTAESVSPTAPYTPEEALPQLTPFTSQLEGRDKRDYERHLDKIRAEDEEIQYGKLKDRIKRQDAKVRTAKRRTKGIKSFNPFVAQALLKDKH